MVYNADIQKAEEMITPKTCALQKRDINTKIPSQKILHHIFNKTTSHKVSLLKNLMGTDSIIGVYNGKRQQCGHIMQDES